MAEERILWENSSIPERNLACLQSMVFSPGNIKNFYIYAEMVIITIAKINCFSIFRWSRDSQWETSTLAVDMDWKRIVLPVMEHYREATDGSYIE